MELNQILGPFWSVYKAENPQDLKKSVNKPELTQKVPRKSFKFWALSGLFTHFKILETFCCTINRPERAQNLIQLFLHLCGMISIMTYDSLRLVLCNQDTHDGFTPARAVLFSIYSTHRTNPPRVFLKCMLFSYKPD